MSYLVKAIHVELANKGGKVVMLEIFRENNIGELVDVFYVKGFPTRCPKNIVKTSLILFLESISTSRMLLNLSINRGIFWIPMFFLNFDILFCSFTNVLKKIIIYQVLFFRKTLILILSPYYLFMYFLILNSNSVPFNQHFDQIICLSEII